MFHPKGPTFKELAVQALSSTQRGYDLLAPKFDYTPFRTPDAVLERVAADIAQLGPFDSGLDVCCGTGAALRIFRPLCRQRLVGLDFSAGMLAEAQRRTAAAPGTAALEFVRADALAMPFANCFDLALCFGALGHILPRDQDRFVAELARVLRPGGCFVFVTAEQPPAWSLRYWLARAFNGAMHVRNLLLSPPFVMFYLTFHLAEARQVLAKHGFTVDVRPTPFDRPFRALRLVVATRGPG